ncbi:MAG: hypothetical protein P8Y07_02455 [Gemmatimonadales bacterium]
MNTTASLDLNTLANLAEVLGVLIVIGGVAFAVVQIREFQRQRRETAAIELARSFTNPQFARALLLVVSLPPGCSAKELRRSPEREEAAMLVSLTLEAVAIMTHHRIVPMRTVWELMGGVTQVCWDRMRDWVHVARREQGNEKFDEWLEWLSNQMTRLGDESEGQPAYQVFEGWRP